ncbi:hypothetical protein MATL_G00123830 [Megalops atlanticus]|uniref:Tyrosine-protein kinase ephrin type A/B receptor-like domain-containing protein n=1 Tax=Megalops atlanticus TaxID=7932 RepID=A0A9D3Q0R0_MEGAT|nr:hypothetical protein MATL_G00123830 [Megalops atlanticus]
MCLHQENVLLGLTITTLEEGASRTASPVLQGRSVRRMGRAAGPAQQACPVRRGQGESRRAPQDSTPQRGSPTVSPASLAPSAPRGSRESVDLEKSQTQTRRSVSSVPQGSTLLRTVTAATRSYCPGTGSARPLPCPVGGYTDAPGQQQCRSCNGTSPCGGTPLWSRTGAHLGQRPWASATCPPGKHLNREEGPACLLCPLGHYCPGGAAIPCPAGTYGAKEGIQRERDCSLCPAGFYCLEGSTGRPGSQFMCPRGYYCEEGTGLPHGTPCPAGTSGGQLAQTSRAACKRCAEGRFCPPGSVDPGLPCARGRFCPAGTLEEITCPNGTFTPHQGAISVKDCLKCPAGFYCPEGTSDPLPCQPGTFNPLEGQDDPADCRPCYAGKACTQTALRAPDVDCMQGFACPPGSSRPNHPASACPPGTLSNRTDLTDRSQCQQCPARYACLRGTGGAQRPPLVCFPGHYCPPGTMFPTQHRCPAGRWSDRSGLQEEAECRPCPRGWYCQAGVGVPSGRCSSGHYCPEGTQYGSQFPCPPGTYSTKMGNGQLEDCLVCPEGYYCQEGTSKPAPCPPTTFRRLKGGRRPQDCSTCPAGFSCPRSATVSPRACGAGSYSDEGSVECRPCLQGHYCSEESTSQETMLRLMVCPPGLLCSQGLDQEPQRSPTLCPKGFYCPGGSVDPNPIPCPNGTYGGQLGLGDLADCTECPVGWFCFSERPRDDPITEPTGGCPDGYYCPLGTGQPHSYPCQAGLYRNASHGHSGGVCVQCPAGSYCARPATHTPTVCPEGSFCAEGSRSPEPCTEGTYSPRPALRNASECTPCIGGKYCSGVGRTEPSGSCEEGFYCREGARSATPADGPTGGLCPAGSFCPAGSTTPKPCPPAPSATAPASAASCSACAAHQGAPLSSPSQDRHIMHHQEDIFYCSASNSTSPTGPCSPGYYCSGGSASSNQHEAGAGHYTHAGAMRAEPCPPGTFQPTQGQGSCLRCERGRFCNGTGLAQPAVCPPGHYCPAGTTLPLPCPLGCYLSQPGGQELQHCGPCDAGQFCGTPGLSAPQGPCDPGFYCSGGASTANPVNKSSGGVCPGGHFCPAGSRHPRENPCPPGTWSNAVGAWDPSSCWLCPPGFFCNSSGLTQPAGLCAAGFYCLGGATSSMPLDGMTGERCPVGYHCPPGSAAPLSCPDGTYSNTTGAAECLDCPPGRYCLEDEGVGLCPEGHFCPGGTGVDVLPCPPGTYSPQPGQSHLEQCLLCPAGMFCEDWGLAEPSGPCEPGYFCLAGINFQNPDANISTGVGGPCPKGHHCPAGTSLPLPCPLGSFSNRAGLAIWTLQGRILLSWGGLLSHWARRRGRICPAAHYCPSGSAVPVPCPAGTYTNLSGQAQCSRCPAGYYCPEKISNYTRFPCPPGFYCLDGTRYATQYPCPRGYYNPEPMTQSLDSCLPCPPGHYCEKERLTTVSGKCKAGWFCVSAAWNSQPFDLDNYTNANCLCPATSTGGRCQEGFFCPAGSPEPQLCPPGAFCNVTGLSQPSGPCSPGYYCTGGATHPRPTNKVTGNICPPGTYCAEGSGEPWLCPAGTFSPVPGLASAAQCQLCPGGSYCGAAGLRAPTGPCSEGYWCPPGQSVGVAKPCPVGHYCPHGSAAPEPCPSGTYQDREKQATCRPCEAGYYCDPHHGPVNTTAPRPCPRGHYCPPGTGIPTQFGCPAGTFNPREGVANIEGCVACPPGKFCPTTGLPEPAGECHAGFWCKEGARTPSPVEGASGISCPAGHYCPTGTVAPLPCPLGTWSNSTGQKSPQECQPCPGGFYCASTGLTAPTGPCSGGFYCTQGAVTPSPTDGTTGGSCPEGHYCPIGTTQPVPCEPGTFITVTQATECSPCPPGWYCVAGMMLLCPAGFYCPEGTGQDWRACPEGTYGSAAGLTDVSQCRECDGGHFCAQRNGTSVTGPCHEGYYCTRGNTSPQPHSHSTGEGGPCPAGHYCPRGAAYPQPCPAGTFSNLTKLVSQEACTPCSQGHYCDTAGLTTPSGECWEGFFCQQGAVLPNSPIRDGRGGPCPSGYFCPRGAAAPQVCPEGFANTMEGQGSCAVCPQGLYCPGNGSSFEGNECAPGYYCPPGSVSERQQPCPPGTFNPETRKGRPEDCLSCTPGYFCSSPGLRAASGPCAAGHFCQGGAASPSPEDGRTGDRCPRGHYCPEGSSSPQPCPPGLYSNATGNRALSDCLPCPEGFSCATPGLSAPSDLCQAGHYCPMGQSSSHPASHTCSPGHMCPPGSSAQQPCAPGTYQDQPGQAECAPCPAGYFCAGSTHPDTGVTEGTHTPTPCPKGHYCPAGSRSGVEFPCPAGTFSDQISVSQAEECAPCPPGRYCSSAGLAAPTGECSPGYLCIHGAIFPQPAGDGTGRKCSPGSYCPQGTTHMLTCPPGTFNPVEGAESAEACLACPSGRYCGRPGLDAPSGPCGAGFFCSLASRSAEPQNAVAETSVRLANHSEDLSSSSEQIGGGICPRGHYCPAGTTQPLPCAPVGSDCSGTEVSGGMVLSGRVRVRPAVRAQMPCWTRLSIWECSTRCVSPWYPPTFTCPACLQTLPTR